MIMRIPILKSILRNLDWFEEARQHHKAPEGTIFVGGINHRLKKEDWVEQKHPRADDGKFTSGSGGGSKKPSKTKRKLERRAEAASQGRVSGAIQTLLSGGSALDKIGWLNTSKPKEPEKKPESKPQQPEKPTAEEKPKIPSHDDALQLSSNPQKVLDGITSSKEIYPFSYEPAEYIKYVLDMKTAQTRNDAYRANKAFMREKSKYGAKHKTYRGIEKDPVYSQAKKENDRLFAEYDALVDQQKKFEAVFTGAGKKIHGLNPYGPEHNVNVS